MTYMTREEKLRQSTKKNSKINRKFSRNRRSQAGIRREQNLAAFGRKAAFVDKTAGKGTGRPKKDKAKWCDRATWLTIKAVCGPGPWRPNTDLQRNAGRPRKPVRHNVRPLQDGDGKDQRHRNVGAHEAPESSSHYGKDLDFETRAQMDGRFAAKFDN